MFKMSPASILFLLPWILAASLPVSLGKVVSSRKRCYVDICFTEQYCDDGMRRCRLCDDIREDCMDDSLPVECRSWCVEYLTNKSVESIIEREKVADCPDLGPLEHGNYTYASNYLHGTTVTFTCDEGHRLFGANTSTCGDFKTWSNPLPVCEVTDCPDLGPLDHGNYTYASNYRYRTTIRFTCDEGHRLFGANTSTCGDFKTWSAPLPVCEEVEVFQTISWQVATFVLAAFFVLLLILSVYLISRQRKRQTRRDEESAPQGGVNYVVGKQGTDTRSSSLKSNSSEDSGIESSRESRTVSEERGGATGRVLDTQRDPLTGRDTHGPLRRGAASEPNIDLNGGIGSAPSTQRAESEPNMESDPRTRSCDTGERHTGESDTGKSDTGERHKPTHGNPDRSQGDGVPYTYIDNSTTVEFHVSRYTSDVRETLNYKSGDRNSSSVYKSNNDKSNNTENGNVRPRKSRKSETAAAPNDASSCTGRNSPQTGNVDLDRASKKQFQEDVKFGTPDTDVTTECRQPEDQGGTFQVITSVEDSFHGIRSPSDLNVRLSDDSAGLGDNATNPDNSERDPLL